MVDRLRRLTPNFLSPEAVKYNSALALKKQRQHQQAQYQAGLMAIAKMIQQEIGQKTQLFPRHTENSDVKHRDLPWLGVGFEQNPNSKEEKIRNEPVISHSKDVQVTWEGDTDKTITLNTVLVDGKDLTPKFTPKTLKIPTQNTKKHREKQGNRGKTQVSKSATVTIYGSNEAESWILPRKEGSEQGKERKVLRNEQKQREVPHANLALRIPSVRRSKTAFSESRIRRNPSRPLPKPKQDWSECLPVATVPEPPPGLSLLLRQKPKRSHSFPLCYVSTKVCLPHRLTVECHLFRKVRKAAEGRLRTLL